MTADEDQGESADETGDREQPVSLWFRWYGNRTVPFHRYCDFARPSERDRRVEPAIRYVYGLPRTLLRHTPVVVLVSLLLYVLSAEFTPRVVGVSEHVSVPSAMEAGVVLWALAGLGLLWYLLATVDVVPKSNFWHVIAVYGAGAVLSGELPTPCTPPTSPSR